MRWESLLEYKAGHKESYWRLLLLLPARWPILGISGLTPAAFSLFLWFDWDFLGFFFQERILRLCASDGAAPKSLCGQSFGPADESDSTKKWLNILSNMHLRADIIGYLTAFFSIILFHLSYLRVVIKRLFFGRQRISLSYLWEPP